jgi:large exoprotein involved in heme utilization and adhesion
VRREGFPGLPLEIGFAKPRVRLVAFGIRGAITLMGYFAIASLGNSAFAQITPDSTLPGEPSVLTPSVIINDLLSDRIDGGAIRGANLFHSFLQFNIGNGEQVYFANPPGIENILGRVTGTEAIQHFRNAWGDRR